jgi:predicted RNase H-like HicB family nuclease
VVDAAAMTPWQRICGYIRRIVRLFESERDDDHAIWTLTVRVREDALDGGWVAECLDLPGCFSQGDTREEALDNLSDAIGGIISLRMEQQLSATPSESDDDVVFKVAVAS